MYTRDGFSDRAQRAFAIGAHRARGFGHQTLETGHILIGLLQQEDSFALAVLKDLGIDPEGLKVEIVKHLPPQTCAESRARCENSLVALRISALAKEERDRLRHECVGTEHVLVALSIDVPGAGCAAAVLAAAGATPEKIRSKLLTLIGAPE